MNIKDKKNPLTIDFVIATVLAAIYKEDILNEALYLKGGQAIRLKENILDRFSADVDFSIEEGIKNPSNFFDILMKNALYAEFDAHGYYLFDFKHSRRPEIKKDSSPDFWGGWAAEFKLIGNSKKVLPIDKLRREALQPQGASSTRIELDFSEYEYCQGSEKIKINSSTINVYSRVLLVTEKIRAICQQHPDYQYRSPSSRARDYYDIEKLWQKVIKEKNAEAFIKDCAKVLPNVFAAKDVPLYLMKKIFMPEFIEQQMNAWETVKASVSERVEDFEYYVETVKSIISKLDLEQNPN